MIKIVQIVFVAELDMALELVGNIYIVCLMKRVYGEAVNKFHQIMYVNIGGIQNERD